VLPRQLFEQARSTLSRLGARHTFGALGPANPIRNVSDDKSEAQLFAELVRNL
jgi:hypothetical protein